MAPISQLSPVLIGSQRVFTGIYARQRLLREALSLIRPTSITGVEGKRWVSFWAWINVRLYFIRLTVWDQGFTEFPFGSGLSGPFLHLPSLSCSYGKAAISHFTDIKHSSLGEGRVNDPGKMSQAGVSKTIQSASKWYLCPEFNIFPSHWACPGGLVRDALT